MANEDYWHHQELNAYLKHQDEPEPIEVPIDVNGEELEPGGNYWRVRHGYIADPVYILDNLDDINAYMEQNYEDGGGLDDYYEAVVQLTDTEENCIAYVLYHSNGQEEERKWTA